MWATAECLRCPAISVTVTSIGRLSRLEARRLQLAAEHGGGVCLVLRPYNTNASIYSAATRWLVRAMPGQRHWQRWQVQLIHGHGGRVGQNVILVVSRETDSVRVLETVGNRSVVAATRQDMLPACHQKPLENPRSQFDNTRRIRLN